MRKLKYCLFIIIIIPILLFTGCIDGETIGRVDDTPPINVNVSGGTITATVPDPLPVVLDNVDTVDGMLRVSSQDYLFSIAEGLVPDHTSFAKIGFNGNIGTAEEDIWTFGGKYIFPTAPMQMELVSTSVEDDPVKADASPGTGVWSVIIVYLDGTYVQHSEIVTLDGTNVVTTTAKDIFRVNTMRAVSVGTNYKAVGDIVIRNLADTPIYRQLAIGETRARAAIHTVPLGQTLYITSVALSSGYSTVGKNVRWFMRANYDDTTGTILAPGLFFMPYFEIQTQDSSFYRQFEIPMRVPPTVDMVVSAISDSSNSVCDVAIRGWLEAN
jgi:hypothetical protein